jgi:hypothetical protein
MCVHALHDNLEAITMRMPELLRWAYSFCFLINVMNSCLNYFEVTAVTEDEHTWTAKHDSGF